MVKLRVFWKPSNGFGGQACARRDGEAWGPRFGAQIGVFGA